MSIFNVSDFCKSSNEGESGIALFCFKCRKMFLTVASAKTFKCDNCQQSYSFESYQLQFSSVLTSVIMGGGGLVTPITEHIDTTNNTPVVEHHQNQRTWTDKTKLEGVDIFAEMYGFEDIKQTLTDILLNGKKVHTLIDGPAGQGKTFILQCILKHFEDAVFLDANTITKSGLVELLFNQRPSILLIDEIDKMGTEHQTILLNVMQTGTVVETKIGKTRRMELPNLIVFATANDVSKMNSALKDRFLRLTEQQYTKDQFYHIATKILINKFRFDLDLVKYYCDECYSKIDGCGIRQLERVATLAGTDKDKIDFYIGVVTKYNS